MTDKLETNPYSFELLTDAIQGVKDTITYTVKATIISVLVINTIAGGSGEMMFNFLNTFQIINMFPLWNLSIPKHYIEFLECMEDAKLNFFALFEIDIDQEYYSRTTSKIYDINSLDFSKTHDEKFESQDYTHSSFILNSSEITS